MTRQRLALVFAGLFIVGGLRYASTLFLRDASPDETAFDHAFALLLAGHSPYDEPRFLYAPVFAHVGAFAAAHLGFFATRVILRLANLAGAVFVAWESARGPRRDNPRVILALLLLVLAPPLVSSVEIDNPSALAVALALGALRVRSRPLAGVLFAASLVVKPIAALALLAAPPVVIGIAVALVGLTLASFPADTAAMIHRADAPIAGLASGSLRHVLELVGPTIPSFVVTALVAVVAVVLIRRHSRAAEPIALTASLLAIPLVWTHSFTLILPIVVGVTVHAWRRRATDRRQAFVLSILGVVILSTASMWRGFLELSPPAQAALTSVPLFVAVLFAWARIKFGPLTAD